jgi:hypothetical protein
MNYDYDTRIASDDEVIVLADYKQRQDLRASIARGLVRDQLAHNVAVTLYDLVDANPDAVDRLLGALGVDVFGRGIGR